MQKKIYVVGMFDEGVAGAVKAGVQAVAGVNSVETFIDKAQVLVDFNEGGGVEDAINKAIGRAGPEVLGL